MYQPTVMTDLSSPATALLSPSAADRQQAGHCFHCGNALTATPSLWVQYREKLQPVCCHGCQAVAQAIMSGGFEQYYQQRQAQEATAPAQEARPWPELQAYDDPGFLARFARRLSNGQWELLLVVEGIRCAACVWLNEQAVRRLPGVISFHINRMTQRASLEFDPGQIRLSAILRAIETVGYRAWPFDREREAQWNKQQQQQLLRQVFVAGLVMMQVMMFASPWYFAKPGEVEPVWEHLLRWASFVLTLPVMLYSAQPLWHGAWKDLRQKRIGMEVPVAIALVAAFVASAWATWAQQGAVYFDSITMFVFLLLGARYLEMLARRRAMLGLSHALRAIPKQLTRRAQEANATVWQTIPLSAVQLGDQLLIKPGETLALDARLLSAQAEMDWSLLSGESRPVLKQRDAELPAGAVNLTQAIEVQVLRLEADSYVSSMERLIERAGQQRPALQTAADRAASWFLAALLLLTLAVGVVWWVIDPARALPIAIAVLVVSCPCALSLATPAALATATATLARRGMLITRGDALEKLARLTDVVFDKTGTLTESRPQLSAVTLLAADTERQVLQIAAAIEARSEHPLARALVEAASQPGWSLPPVQDWQAFPGQGIEAHVNGVRYRLGNAPFCSIRQDQTQQTSGAEVYLADDNGALAAFHFDLALRPQVKTMLEKLRRQGLALHLLSGDNAVKVKKTAAALGIFNAEGGLLPEQKVQRVQALQRQGKVVAMVGDGVNDAPVLAGADVSIAMGDGTELAQITADAVLMNRLDVLVEAVQCAQRTLAVMKQNLIWAGTYNALAIPAAAMGWVSPLAAAIGMSASSLWVILNAMRLLKWKASTY